MLISILFDYGLSHLGEFTRPVRDTGVHLVFGTINVIMRFASIAGHSDP